MHSNYLAGKFNTFSNSEGHQTFRFETQSSEDDSSVGQENNMDPLSDFAVDQGIVTFRYTLSLFFLLTLKHSFYLLIAAQISKLTENERKRNRTLRFAQPSQNQKVCLTMLIIIWKFVKIMILCFY